MNKMKKWLELRVRVSPWSSEAVSNFFFETGALGIQQMDDLLTGYFHYPDDPEKFMKAANIYVNALNELGLPTDSPSFHVLNDQDWAGAWKAYFKPVFITDELAVKPPWEKLAGKTPEHVIDINPGLAFGTGTHETTQLCLELLIDLVKPGFKVLDAGTGSAVLAIAAVKLGADKVTAFDVDADALENAYENCLINKAAGRIDLYNGSIDSIEPFRADIVVANINRIVLESMIKEFVPFLGKTSTLIVSGLLVSEKEMIQRAIEKSGMIIKRTVEKGEWAAFAAGLLL